MSLATIPQRRRLTPDARRAELLRAGERVFTESSYEDVSIEQIAEAAGVSKKLMRGAGGDSEVLAIVATAHRRVVERTIASLPLEGATPPAGLELALYGW